MNTFARKSWWVRTAQALPEEGKLCFGAAAGCLAVGALGWTAGSALPAFSDLSALLVVGVLYVGLGIPSLFRMTPLPPMGEAPKTVNGVPANRPQAVGSHKQSAA